MDEELRKLERQAASGDQNALYRLLIRKLSIDDFDIADLDYNVRFNLAVELGKTFTTDGQTSIYVRSDQNFDPNYTKHNICPNGHIDISYYELSWSGFYTDITDDEIRFDYASRDDNTVDTHLFCNMCYISWRVPPDINVELY